MELAVFGAGKLWWVGWGGGGRVREGQKEGGKGNLGFQTKIIW